MDRGSQLDEEDDEEDDEEEEERRRRGGGEEERRRGREEEEQATDIKSNNPHLAGGEKIKDRITPQVNFFQYPETVVEAVRRRQERQRTW